MEREGTDQIGGYVSVLTVRCIGAYAKTITHSDPQYNQWFHFFAGSIL